MTHRPFRRVGVVNRAEAATRFLRGARAWSLLHDAPLEVVAFYTDPDAGAPFVRDADAEVALGPAMVAAPDGRRRSAYLDIPTIVARLVESGCDAVWPGWGFLSENPAFVDAVTAAGIVFIGPPAEAMRRLGDKIAAKRLAEANGVPVTPWSHGPVADAAEARLHAERIGYPVLVKAVAGGGGRGIRVVTDPTQLEAAFRSASDEARAAFGDASLLVEALLPEARHVEVQVLADAHGNVHAVGTRDCSMQRRHQKVIEEGPAPYLPAATLDGVCRSAVAVARASGYINAGTAEFLVTSDGERFVFLEMNTRLQVEHPVTECTTGLDLVGAQIDVAMGARIESTPPARGHAIEVRLNAEDPEHNFAPSAGRLHRFDLPHGPGVRVDSGFEAGGTVPTEFDSMLAKLIVTGATRDEALARLTDALTRTTIAIEGGASNRALLLDLVRSPEFRRGPVTTRWLDRWVTDRPSGLGRAGAAVALVAGTIIESEHVRRRHVVNFLRQARGGGVPTSAPVSEPRAVRFSLDGTSVALEVATIGPRRYRVSDGTGAVEARFEFTDRSTGTLTIAGRRHRVVVVRSARELSIEIDGVAHSLRRASDGRVIAPLPAVVAGVDVKAGEVVTAGQRLATLEVMKMEFAVESPVDGVVTRVLVDPGVHVSAGDAIAFVVAARDSMSIPAPDVLKAVAGRRSADDWGDPIAVLRGTLLGYELPAPAVTAALAALRDQGATLPLARLLDLLEVHVAREALFDRALLGEGTAAVDAFAEYLRLPARDGLVEGFEPLLVRALACYEVRSLAVTPILESALLRIAQARRTRDDHGVILLAALSALDRLADAGATDDTARALFERLSTLEAARNPRLADAAWTAAYLLCDRVDHVAATPLPPGPELHEELARLSLFDLTWIPSAAGARVALARAHADPGDARLIGFVQLQRLPAPGEDLDRCYLETVHTLRRAVSAPEQLGVKLGGARLVLAFHEPLPTNRGPFEEAARTLAAPAAGLGLEVLVLRGSTPDGRRVAGRWTAPSGHGGALAIGDPDPTPVRPVGAYERRVFDARRRGGFVPHELFRVLAREDADGPLPPGRFVELDLDPKGALVAVDRGRGENTANLLVGRVVNRYAPFHDGLTRVLIVGDPGRAMGSLAEPECRRIIAAFDLAEREGLPVEWIPVSSGAKIAMDSGTENLDWTARVLARIVRFTQGGGTVHVLVDGVCVGAQSYWNAEATMLQHCRGALLMTPRGAMLLTGKRALELAGSVSAEDNLAIGGFERVMGPNGEAQYFAADIVSAYRTLFRLYAFTHVMPGERAPRRLASVDPVTRDFGTAPYEPAADGFTRVGEIFDETANPGRKRPFAIRPVLRAVLDQDHEPLERWAPWEGAESAVVYDGSLGGVPVTCIGVESRPVRRRGEAAPDGPSQWTAGTLFPLSSKKVARALNAASGVRPAVVLANLSGFDGSPESLRELQLEYGAEIGRAVVNFRGRLIFCVISRYHGGAYVVFSRALNEGLDAMALSGSYASVIGGAPAAEVVFPGVVRKRAAADREVVAARALLEVGTDAEQAAALMRYEQALKEATMRERAAVAREFDAVHTVERARDVGSIGAIVTATGLREELARRIAG